MGLTNTSASQDFGIAPASKRVPAKKLWVYSWVPEAELNFLTRRHWDGTLVLSQELGEGKPEDHCTKLTS